MNLRSLVLEWISLRKLELRGGGVGIVEAQEQSALEGSK